MANLGNFNPDEVKDDRELLPDGEYAMQVIESDVVATKSGNGQLLKLTYEVIEGNAARRKLWDQINIAHQSAEAQEIGQRQLKRLCGAIGITGPVSDSEQLHFKPFRGTVATEPGRDGWGPKNKITGFRPYGPQAVRSQPAPAATTADQSPSQQAEAQAVAQAAAGAGSRPWARGSNAA